MTSTDRPTATAPDAREVAARTPADADAGAAPPRTVTAEGHRTRTDIQGLRAIAVAAVVVYHVWPGALPGGYVGVDVFFVLSGFLITSHLVRHPPTTPRALWSFWGRRIRRLLPASALVALVTVVAALTVLPSSVVPETSREGVSSALYVQNWALALARADYLAAEGTETPFRHYWSLSVEEQFYLVWPVVIGLTVLLAAAWHRRRRALPAATALPKVLAGVVGAVVAASFAWSVHLVATNPADAYYVTPGRVWELGVGGLVALAALRPRTRAVPDAVRSTLAWAGLAAVAWSVVRFDASTPFPGAAALVPVLGTAVVVLARTPETSRVGRALAWRPAQVLGDVSYSTYLWHWPLIVFAPYVLGGEPSTAEWLAVIVASVALAWATKTWLEDPVRRSARLARPWWTLAVLVACTTTAASAAAGLGAWATMREAAGAAALAAARNEHPDCFGAAATRPGADCADLAGTIWTSALQAADDRSRLYADGCWNNEPYRTRHTCRYPPTGEPSPPRGGDGATSSAPDDGGTRTGDGAPLRVALVGNSHAGHWFPPLEAVAAERGWELTTYVASVCYPVDVPLRYDTAEAAAGCSAWNDWVRAEVTGGGYDLVVMSARTDQHLADVAETEEDAVARTAYGRVLTELTDAGLDVLVIRDTPHMGTSVPDCVDGFGAAACERPRETALEVDPLAEAAAADRSGHTAVLDVTDTMCSQTTCHPVIGGLIAFFDHGHLTSTFARTLTPEVTEALDALLDGRSDD